MIKGFASNDDWQKSRRPVNLQAKANNVTLKPIFKPQKQYYDNIVDNNGKAIKNFRLY